MGRDPDSKPAMNAVTAPFLYMINNGYLKIHYHQKLDQAGRTQEILEELDSNRIESVSNNIDLFSIRNIITTDVPNAENFSDVIKEGYLYGVTFTDYLSIFEKVEVPLDRYNYMLFMDITRDGMRLVIPIYKLFSLDEEANEVGFVPVDFNKSVKGDIQSQDKLLIARGDNLRRCIRNLKKQNKFKQKMLEGAGVVGEFQLDKI